MSQPDQIPAKSNPVACKPSYEHNKPFGTTASSNATNEAYKPKLAVLASIPDIYAPAMTSGPKPSSFSSSKRAQNPSGRLISAGLSLKLLTGLIWLLVLGALVPHLVSKVIDMTNSSSLSRSWQPPSPAPTADLAPVWKPEAGILKAALDSKTNVPATSPEKTLAPIASSAGTAPENNLNTDKANDNQRDIMAMLKRDNGAAQSSSLMPPAASTASETLKIDNKIAVKDIRVKSISPSAKKDFPDLLATPDNSQLSRDRNENTLSSPWPNPVHPPLVESYSNNKAAPPANTGTQGNRPYTVDRRNGPFSGVLQQTTPATVPNVSGAAASHVNK